MTPIMKWTGFIATLAIVILFPVYTHLESNQQEKLLEKFYSSAVVASTQLYAENCAVCHGGAGGGIGENPPLNSDAVRMSSETDLSRVISRGRDNTLMAAWAS